MSNIARCWQVLLMDGDKLRPEAQAIMDDLEKVCGWHHFALPLDRTDAVDPLRLAAEHSRRGVYAYILKRLKEPLTKDKK